MKTGRALYARMGAELMATKVLPQLDANGEFMQERVPIVVCQACDRFTEARLAFANGWCYRLVRKRIHDWSNEKEWFCPDHAAEASK